MGDRLILSHDEAERLMLGGYVEGIEEISDEVVEVTDRQGAVETRMLTVESNDGREYAVLYDVLPPPPGGEFRKAFLNCLAASGSGVVFYPVEEVAGNPDRYHVWVAIGV